MDDMKKKIVIGYLIGIVLLILIIPWKINYQTGNFKGKISEGYGFILSPPNPSASSIDFSLIFLEIIFLTAVAGIVYMLREKIFKQSVLVNRSADIKDNKSAYDKVEANDNAPWVLDKEGNISGSVTRTSDGKNVMRFGPGADLTTLAMSFFITFSDYMNEEKKTAFAAWAGLPSGQWTSQHRSKFSLAMTHHFHDLKESGAIVPKEIKTVIDMLPPNTLPPLERSLTNEVRRIFNGLFA